MFENGPADQEAGAREERRQRLSAARELLVAALELLDTHAHSPAPAMVDLAIHHLDGELAD